MASLRGPIGRSERTNGVKRGDRSAIDSRRGAWQACQATAVPAVQDHRVAAHDDIGALRARGDMHVMSSRNLLALKCRSSYTPVGFSFLRCLFGSGESEPRPSCSMASLLAVWQVVDVQRATGREANIVDVCWTLREGGAFVRDWCKTVRGSMRGLDLVAAAQSKRKRGLTKIPQVDQFEILPREITSDAKVLCLRL
jgi:hypothetical protein